MQNPANIPQSENELIERAQAIAGFTLGELAERYYIKVPKSLQKEKGWIGLLFEHILGASAGSRP